jgi:hypothetical protein
MAFRSCTTAFLLLTILLASCSKPNDPVPPAPGPGGPAPFQPALSGPQGVEMTVDGEVVTLVQGGGIIPFYLVDGVQNTPPSPSYRFYTAGMHTNGENVFELHLGTLSYSDPFLDPGEFEEFFSPGPREYGQTNVSGISRVAIEYLDEDGTLWSTLQGSAAQPNSSFVITAVNTGFDDLGVYARIIVFFSCAFYNSGGANKPVTNGVLTLEFREY